MIITEEHLKIAALFLTIAVPTTLGIIAAYRKNNSKIIRHDERIYGHDTDIKAVHVKIKELDVGINGKIKDMETEFSADIKGLREDISKIKDNNRDDHRILFEKVGSIAETMAEIKGYIIAKSETEKKL
jgi:Skp family chaperone for outer membrane proteins